MAGALSRAAEEFRSFVALLRSRMVTVGSITALLALYALGLVIPQRIGIDPASWAEWRASHPRLVGWIEWAGLDDVYTSPLVYTVLVIFCASLLAVLWERVPRAARSLRLSYGLPFEVAHLARRPGAVVHDGANPRGALIRAEGVLAAKGYRLWRAGSGVRGVRFRFAPVGFFLFHGSFLLLLAAGAMLDATRFAARIRVAEGEAFDASRGPYLMAPRLPRAGGPYPELAFSVIQIRSLQQTGSPVGLEVDVLVAGELQPRTLKVNRPLEQGSTSLLVMNVGAAPLFTCEVGKEERDGAYVKLFPGEQAITRYQLPGCELEVLARDARAVAVAARRGGSGVMLGASPSGAGSDLPSGLELAIRGPDGAVSRGIVKPGDTLTTADGSRTVRMHRGRRYAELLLVDERGGALLWIAFGCAVVGLVSRLLLYRREIVVAVDGTRTVVAAAQDAAGIDGQRAVVDAVAAALRDEDGVGSGGSSTASSGAAGPA